MNIDCEMARDLLPMYKDGCLSGSSVKALRRHLTTCAPCRKYLREYRISTRAAQTEPAGDFMALAKRLRQRRQTTELFLGVFIAALSAYAIYKTVKKN